MATVGGSYNRKLFGMDFHQSSEALYQKPNQQGMLNHPFCSTSLSGGSHANDVPMGSSVNLNNAYFNMYSICSPGVTVMDRSINQFIENPASQSLESRFSSRLGKRHKRHEDIFKYHSKKRRVSESSEAFLSHLSTESALHVDNIICGASGHSWNTTHSQHECTSGSCSNSSTIMPTTLNEEMEETSDETVSSYRKLEEDDCRLTIADENVGKNNPVGRLPTLIMSDVLKEGLKNGFEESFTKKIVDSMNRPSMELVLWKPQPEFLIDRLQAVSESCKKETAPQKHACSGSENSFSESKSFKSDHFCSSILNSDIRIIDRREEEEMEL
ncbi:hypothetical protein GDO86_002115 [Hymenochirus boettgeri]|uniref:Uncharacterized protein n=1 Tax=Hymenochirus boettgeri TaxID=247094 RepID=A0A8T2KP89_9PIPI|nr:hypothetical protein GDO86_002115 [Hymenochirus boettgeri]KAG8456197.1 hypothetical protein GDO86_002115 [Hymenochirus boettgeri]